MSVKTFRCQVRDNLNGGHKTITINAISKVDALRKLRSANSRPTSGLFVAPIVYSTPTYTTTAAKAAQ